MKLKYSETLLDNAFLKVTTKQPEKNRHDEIKFIPFISNFNKNPNIYYEIISPACHSLGLDNPINNYKFIKAFRQPESFLRILNNKDKATFERFLNVMKVGVVAVKLFLQANTSPSQSITK